MRVTAMDSAQTASKVWDLKDAEDDARAPVGDSGAGGLQTPGREGGAFTTPTKASMAGMDEEEQEAAELAALCAGICP